MSAGESWEGGEPKSNTGKMLLIIGLVGCGGLVLVVAICGGVGYWFYTKMQAEAPGARAAAEAFLDDVKANHIDAAYARMSQQYHKTMTHADFVNYLKAFPVLASYTSRNVMMTVAMPIKDSGAATITMQLQSPKGMQMCTITLIKEGGDWKIQQLQVQ
ncbi:MAG TPA: hypothetical protein VFA18_06300 [Gemmataceae bacterium]|nr:hypothetical protein [Gemmataceae bacterium]